ncbi:f2d3244d-05e3-41a2-8eea-ac010158683c [Thermothielavioides terrestris]|uniref:F2d3244d-05e3-41a2-8eea-ac010158683c n=1 Tax=Thermothielavioides terrestris TaxID=2587410 RepID=A0A446BFT6_9PEZI|nr:f2d3244d-05e3-41a2-8eea-ac010158683c [Thermothielavioides terrestris]
MGKLPTTLMRRPSLAPGSCLPSTSPAAAAAAATTITASPRTPLAHAAFPWPPAPSSQQQVRHATFVLRPRRPYQFTQLVQLSDGSTFTMRTTSPVALYKAAKDSRNHILWQPSEKSLKNVEVDEAGKLAAFRGRYGNVWNLEGPTIKVGEQAQTQQQQQQQQQQEEGKTEAEKEGAAAKAEGKPAEPATPEDPFDSLVDLISAYATEDKNLKGGLSAKDQARLDKRKK